jgi:hypothetical protein
MKEAVLKELRNISPKVKPSIYFGKRSKSNFAVPPLNHNKIGAFNSHIPPTVGELDGFNAKMNESMMNPTSPFATKKRFKIKDQAQIF